MAHEPMPYEVKAAVEFGTEVELIRIPCSCGWRGCWFATDEAAMRSYQRHAERERQAA